MSLCPDDYHYESIPSLSPCGYCQLALISSGGQRAVCVCVYPLSGKLHSEISYYRGSHLVMRGGGHDKPITPCHYHSCPYQQHNQYTLQRIGGGIMQTANTTLYGHSLSSIKQIKKCLQSSFDGAGVSELINMTFQTYINQTVKVRMNSMI